MIHLVPSGLHSHATSFCREGSDEEAEPGREDEEDDESANMTNR
jgi:hypothetical protein